jgi:hypothetical protein
MTGVLDGNGVGNDGVVGPGIGIGTGADQRRFRRRPERRHRDDAERQSTA